MTLCRQRSTQVEVILQACESSARLHMAYSLIGLHLRTLQRWQSPARPSGNRQVSTKRRAISPANKFSQTKREAALTLLKNDEFKDMPLSQIVPHLTDQDLYVTSESIQH